MSDEERAFWYALWHIHDGASWFIEDDLQIVASLNRRGLVFLNPDYEGFYVCPTERAKPMQKRSEKWEDIWRSHYNAYIAKKVAAAKALSLP